jgi:hypothetical protein
VIPSGLNWQLHIKTRVDVGDENLITEAQVGTVPSKKPARISTRYWGLGRIGSKVGILDYATQLVRAYKTPGGSYLALTDIIGRMGNPPMKNALSTPVFIRYPI